MANSSNEEFCEGFVEISMSLESWVVVHESPLNSLATQISKEVVETFAIGLRIPSR